MKSQSFKFLAFVFLIVLFFFTGRFLQIDQNNYQQFLQSFPLIPSAVVFVVLYVVVTFFVWLGPKDIFRIAAAVIFGAGLSTLLVWIGEMINAAVLFTLSRKLGREFVESKLKGGWQRLDQTIATTSVWWIFLLKLTPIVPFRFLDLGFGLTKISLKKYWIISALASPLRIFILQFFLSLGVQTVIDPNQLSDYLLAHPLAMNLTCVYMIGSLVVVFFLQRKWKGN